MHEFTHVVGVECRWRMLENCVLGNEGRSRFKLARREVDKREKQHPDDRRSYTHDSAEDKARQQNRKSMSSTDLYKEQTEQAGYLGRKCDKPETAEIDASGLSLRFTRHLGKH